MSASGRLYLVCYDITDPKRLNRVARYLQKYACRVQYSVFATQIRTLRLDEVLEGLDHIIEPKLDDIRAYPLPPAGDVAILGTQLFPEDVLLLRHGRNLFRLGKRTRKSLG